MKKALFIGGTGTISSAITRLAAKKGWELYLLNRGNRSQNLPEGVHSIIADINDEKGVAEKIADMRFDVVADFIAFTSDQVERDIRLFAGKTNQYIFISSASAYQKPPQNAVVTESVPLKNPYWQYSRDKIACEDLLTKVYREQDFPMTIVRPSHTYAVGGFPVAVAGNNGKWQVYKRMLEGKPVIIPGDGTSLWTLTFNEDFAKAFVGLMGNPHAIGEAFHITSDEVNTWDQIYMTLARTLGGEFKPYHISSQMLNVCSGKDYIGGWIGDKANCAIFDNSKVKKLVPDFVATTRMDEGARLDVEYMLAHPELQVEDPEFDAWCDRVIQVFDEAAASVLA